MLITSTVEICIEQLGRVEEMVFTTRRSYASAVLGVVILSVCPFVCLSVCHTHALWLIQRTYRRYFYTTWKGNLSSQMWFFVQLWSSWQDFNWLKASHGPSAIAEIVVIYCTDVAERRSTKLCTMFARLLGWYTIYFFRGLFGWKIHFASKSCVLLLAALLHSTQAMGVSQTLRRSAESATYIQQGGHHAEIGLHSSWILNRTSSQNMSRQWTRLRLDGEVTPSRQSVQCVMWAYHIVWRNG